MLPLAPEFILNSDGRGGEYHKQDCEINAGYRMLLLDRVNLEAYVQVHDNVGPLREHVGTTYSFELSESAANWIGIWSQQQNPFLVQSLQSLETLPPADLAADSSWMIKDLHQPDVPWTVADPPLRRVARRATLLS